MKPDLSTKDFAKVIGSSESSVKRWADDGRIQITRTEGGHRRIPVSEAIRYIHAKRLTVMDPVPLGIRELEPGLLDRESPEKNGKHLEESIVSGNVQNVRSIVANMYLGGWSVGEICDGPITLAMHRVGELWKHNADGIFIEHRATETCVQALGYLRSIIPLPARSAPTALGCASEDDVYLLPTWMAASTLASEGWDALNLGPNLPFSALLRAIEEFRPRLVWISISTYPEEKRLRAQLRQLLNESALADVAVVVGGRASGPFRGLDAPLHYGGSMCEIAAFARGLVASDTA